MTTVILHLDDELAARLAERAQAAGVSPDELAGRVLGEFLQHAPAVRKLEFIAMGSSEELQPDRVDELLAQGYGVVALLVDTDVLVGAANRDDRNHDACVKLITTAVSPLIVP
ncbi:MAG: hypothetical protein ACRD0K_17135 [Egibacteraceae bacterium]